MDKERQLQLLEESRQQMHRMIDEKYDALIRSVESGESISCSEPTKLSLAVPPIQFKGRKPSEVIFPDGHSVQAKTWKAVATAILRDCNADEQMHDTLMYLRGRTAGRLRYILSHAPEELDAPLKIDDKLYFEGKFDTEYLLKMLTQRVLKPVGYPYQGITILLRPEQIAEFAEADEQNVDCEEDEDEGFSQQMM